MIKKTISVLILLLFIAGSKTAAQNSIKVGYMNMQQVMQQHPLRDSVETQLNEFITEKNNVLEERASTYFEALSEFEENKDSMSEEQRTARQQELAATDQELVQFRNNINTQIQQRQQQLLGPILQEINSVTAEIAQELELDFVFNEKTGVGENIVYFSSKNELNITDRVITRIRN